MINSLIFFVLFLPMCFFGWFKDNKSEAEKTFDAVALKALKFVENKYGIEPMGIGGGMPDGFIHNFNASFKVKKNLTIEQIRPLLISIVNDYLHIINEDKTIKKYLYKTPFTVEGLSINLFFYDNNNRCIQDPEISVAGVLVGNLSYQSYKSRKNNLPLTIKDIEETYEDALKILQEQQKS